MILPKPLQRLFLSSRLPRVVPLLLLLLGAGFLQAEEGVWKADPDHGKYKILPWPKGDPTYWSKSEYLGLAQNAARKKLGKKLNPANVEFGEVWLRQYPGLPVQEQNVIAVLLTPRITWSELNYHRLDSRTMLVVLIRKDRKKINLYPLKTTIQEISQ